MIPAARLLRWLGPWSEGRVPRGVRRDRHMLARPAAGAGAPLLGAYVYEGRSRARGLYVVVPGLHFLGPDDPRLDRFCRILAASGFVVVAPLLPDFLDLRVAPSTTDDLAVAHDFACDLAERRGLGVPALFSISFGSQPAIALAGREGYADRIARLVVFGGYADFEATVRFAVTGEAEHEGARLRVARDPLNSPVVYMNLLPHLELDVDRPALMGAWRAMVERTWGKMELKEEGARDPFAHAIARELRPRERELFLAGCGLHASSRELLVSGLDAARGGFAFADPAPHLAKVRAPVALVHGRDDDVIPYFEAHKLARALPAGHPCRVMITGMYGHTGSALPSVRALGREVATLARVIHTLSTA